MCGLVGIAAFRKAGIYLQHQKAFKDLLIADSVRGSDGTGMFSINAKGRRTTLKTAANPYELFMMKDYDTITSTVNSPFVKVLAGHNRYATTGDIIDENSHPFYHEGITMMHNGTLRDYKNLPDKVDKEGQKYKFEVDSDHFCYGISQWGIAKTIENIEGAYAVVFYDSKTKTLNMARNSERPLFLAINERDEEIAWASEIDMLSWVLSRNKLDKFKIFDVGVNKLHTLSIDRLNLKITNLPLTGSGITKNYWHSSRSLTVTEQNYYGFGGTFEDDPKPKNNIILFDKKGEEKKQVKKPQGRLQAIPSIATKGAKPYIYTVGDDLEFTPYDLTKLDEKGERFKINGKRNDLPANVNICANITGKEMAEILVEEVLLHGRIKNMVDITRNGHSQIYIWIENVDMLPCRFVENETQQPVTKH